MELNNFFLKIKKFYDESLLILKLGYPLIISQLLMVLMGFFDSIMAGNVSPIELAGLAIALAIFHPLFLLVLGILIPLSAIISQLFGADNSEEIVKNTIQGLWLSQIFAFLSIIFLSNSHHFLYEFGYEEEVIRQSLAWISEKIKPPFTLKELKDTSLTTLKKVNVEKYSCLNLSLIN